MCITPKYLEYSRAFLAERKWFEETGFNRYENDGIVSLCSIIFINFSNCAHVQMGGKPEKKAQGVGRPQKLSFYSLDNVVIRKTLTTL